jgi:hypothetical protein
VPQLLFITQHVVFNCTCVSQTPVALELVAHASLAGARVVVAPKVSEPGLDAAARLDALAALGSGRHNRTLGAAVRAMQAADMENALLLQLAAAAAAGNADSESGADPVGGAASKSAQLGAKKKSAKTSKEAEELPPLALPAHPAGVSAGFADNSVLVGLAGLVAPGFFLNFN